MASTPPKVDTEHPAFAAGAIGNKNVFFGILVGCVAGALYNKFGKTKLPDFLAFFSGRRCVPILTAAVMSIISLLLLFIWPAVYGALVWFGESIMGLSAVGAGIYAFFNRLLIPTGLHHALNNVFWFNLASINDIRQVSGAAPTRPVARSSPPAASTRSACTSPASTRPASSRS